MMYFHFTLVNGLQQLMIQLHICIKLLITIKCIFIASMSSSLLDDYLIGFYFLFRLKINYWCSEFYYLNFISVNGTALIRLFIIVHSWNIYMLVQNGIKHYQLYGKILFSSLFSVLKDNLKEMWRSLVDWKRHFSLCQICEDPKHCDRQKNNIVSP